MSSEVMHLPRGVQTSGGAVQVQSLPDSNLTQKIWGSRFRPLMPGTPTMENQIMEATMETTWKLGYGRVCTTMGY